MAPNLKGTKKNKLKPHRKKVMNDDKLIKEFKKFKNYIENNTIDVGKNFSRKKLKDLLWRKSF